MKSFTQNGLVLAAAILLGALVGLACNQTAGNATTGQNKQPEAEPSDKKIQRFGMAIGLKEEKKDYYNKLHAEPWPEINAIIKKCNIQKYVIYEGELDGKLYLFGYMEYVGDDFDKDMAKIAADPMTQKWWKETDPCQRVLPGTPKGEQWKPLEEVYRLK